MQALQLFGANTRRYHGLLVAPLTPPGRRNLLLSKVDESVEIDGKKYDIYSNIGKTYMSKGYKYLISFEKDYIPIYTYKIEDVIIKKLKEKFRVTEEAAKIYLKEVEKA